MQSHIIPFRPLDYVDSCVDLPEGVYLKTEEQFESVRVCLLLELFGIPILCVVVVKLEM